MNIWKSVFVKSRANESHYDENCLPDLHWVWPKGTWFQARLDYARDHAFVGRPKDSKKLADLDIAWSDLKSAEAIEAPEETVLTIAPVLQPPDNKIAADLTPRVRGKVSRARQPRQKRLKTSTRKKTSPPPMCAS
jgi:hypothetical protein